MSSLSSPTDTDPPSSEVLPAGMSRTSTAPSSVTSESPVLTSSPALNPIDDLPTPKLRLGGERDEKLTSRELVAPVPSDFPGKKPNRSAHLVEKGDFESDKHFYARCRMISFPYFSSGGLTNGSQRTDSSYCCGIL